LKLFKHNDKAYQFSISLLYVLLTFQSWLLDETGRRNISASTGGFLTAPQVDISTNL